MLGHFVKGAGILGGGIAALVFHVGEAGRRRASASWTTSYQPTAQWNSNWDRRDPELCVRPPADSSEQEKSRYNEEVKKAKPMATRYLYLVRHGEFNVYEQLDSDRTLTKLGRQQAELTGQRLKQLGVPFTSLVHSTMTRAVETAGLIHEHLKQVPVTSCELIREGEPMPPEPPFGIWKPQSKGPSGSSRGVVPHVTGPLQHLRREDRTDRKGLPEVPGGRGTPGQGVHLSRIARLRLCCSVAAIPSHRLGRHAAVVYNQRTCAYR
ncbi:serine/threonine-protein phosphatase Pgam5, mitochondrial-like isoform X2 [Amblyomma americanum]